MNKEKQETAEGAGQILKLTGGKWKKIAFADVKSVPKSSLKALKVKCN